MGYFNRKVKKTDFEIFINILMKKGKKEKAFTIFKNMLNFLTILLKNSNESPFDVIQKAIHNVRPGLKLVTYFVRRKKYLYPGLLSDYCAKSLAIRWLVKYSKFRRESTIAERLANEIYSASQLKGYTMGKKRNYSELLDKAQGSLYRRK